MRNFAPFTLLSVVLLAGATLLAGCSISSGSGGGEPPELPATVGDLYTDEVSCTESGVSDLNQCVENVQKSQVVVDAAAKSLSDAYGGAGAAGVSYRSAGFERSAIAFVVTRQSPGLWDYGDTEAWELRVGTQSLRSVERSGDAECLVQTMSHDLGDEIPDEDKTPYLCQATAAGITVRVLPGSLGLQDALSITQELFDAVR